MTQGPAVAPFIITRPLAAQRSLVWACLSDPEHLKHWWGPSGIEIVASRMEFRVGGFFHYTARNSDGSEWRGLFRFREIQEPTRIVIVNSFADEDRNVIHHPAMTEWPKEMLVTFTLEDTEAGTKLTIRTDLIDHVLPTEAETFDANRESLTGGWGGSLDKLEAWLGARA